MPPKKKSGRGQKTKKPVRKKTIPKKSIPPRPSETKKAPKPATKNPEPKKQRAPRKKVTLESHNKKFEDLLDLINKEIERKSREKEKGTRTFQRIRKIVRELHKETPKIANGKRKVRSTPSNRVSGFMIKYPINGDGAQFLQVEKGTLLSRREVTNAICVYSHLKPDEKRPQMLKWAYLNPQSKRDLQKPGKRMVIEPNGVLVDLLGYQEYQKQVKAGKVTKRTKIKGTSKTVEEIQEDDALYYWVMQKLIGQLFDKPKPIASE